jgi:hypothetical protein
MNRFTILTCIIFIVGIVITYQQLQNTGVGLDLMQANQTRALTGITMDVLRPPSDPRIGGMEYELQVETTIQYHTPMRIDSSQVIGLEARVASAQIYQVYGKSKDGKSSRKEIPQQAGDDIKLIDISNALGEPNAFKYRLNLAGMEVQPSGENPISRDGRTWWSVAPKTVGEFNGRVQLIYPDTTSESKAREDLVSIHVNESSIDKMMVAIRVIDKRFEPRSYIPTFLGPLLTLPGIILAGRGLWDWIKKKREERQKKKRIILP